MENDPHIGMYLQTETLVLDSTAVPQLEMKQQVDFFPGFCTFCSPASLPAAPTTKPRGVSALQPLNTRGSHEPRGEVSYSDVLVYSLLGLCLTMLLSTMVVALLVLLKRARGQKEREEKVAPQPDGHRQTSKGTYQKGPL